MKFNRHIKPYLKASGIKKPTVVALPTTATASPSVTGASARSAVKSPQPTGLQEPQTLSTKTPSNENLVPKKGIPVSVSSAATSSLGDSTLKSKMSSNENLAPAAGAVVAVRKGIPPPTSSIVNFLLIFIRNPNQQCLF